MMENQTKIVTNFQILDFSDIQIFSDHKKNLIMLSFTPLLLVTHFKYTIKITRY